MRGRSADLLVAAGGTIVLVLNIAPTQEPIWGILGTSVAVTVILVTALIASSLRTQGGPPDLHITIGAPATVSGGLAYDIIASNTGGETAEHVEVEVTIGRDMRAVTLAAVARSDAEKAVVVFPLGTSGTPVAEVQSYTLRRR